MIDTETNIKQILQQTHGGEEFLYSFMNEIEDVTTLISLTTMGTIKQVEQNPLKSIMGKCGTVHITLELPASDNNKIQWGRGVEFKNCPWSI